MVIYFRSSIEDETQYQDLKSQLFSSHFIKKYRGKKEKKMYI